MSKNVISVSDISAVIFIAEWKLFAFSTKLSILFRLVYIDDVFSLWNTSLDIIESFVEKANNFHSTILKFTAEMSETEITFLDTKAVYKGVRFDKESMLDVQIH